MPLVTTITIRASTQAALPSPQQLQTWIQAWSNAASSAVWGQPVSNANVTNISVKNLSLERIAKVIEPAVNTYNHEHPGNNTITVVIAEEEMAER